MITPDKPLLEREKWQAEQNLKIEELELKRRKLEIREVESKRARWSNPLVIAVLSAAVAGVGSIVATLYSTSQQRDADERKAVQTQKLETEKAEATLILEMVKTFTPDRAADNLKFLVDTKLITNQAKRDDINAYLKSTKEAGTGVFIPPSPVLNSGVTFDFRCAFKNSTIHEVADSIDTAVDKSASVIHAMPWSFDSNNQASTALSAPDLLNENRLQLNLTFDGKDTRITGRFSVVRSSPASGSLVRALSGVLSEAQTLLPNKAGTCPEMLARALN